MPQPDRILVGDCRDVLPTLPDASVHCVVTSPPYWGLRDYGVDHQIGLEETPDAYMADIVSVFREVRRILRPDGTLWLNLGDSYAAGGHGGHSSKSDTFHSHKTRNGDRHPKKAPPGFKPKDLVGIPWRVALTLQASGWYLRQDIIWHKPNPMPESVRDRCTKAHEYVFLLSKSKRYYFDQEAIKVPGSGLASGNTQHKYVGTGDPRNRTKEGLLAEHGKLREMVNPRSVWTIATQPYRGAHFAVFPEALARPCVVAGCPAGGVVLDPFLGSGTVGVVAEATGREWLGIELNGEYAMLAEERLAAARAKRAQGGPRPCRHR